MSAFTAHFSFEFKTGIRNKNLLLMNYLFPLGFYLMMGDNRNNSYDGRKWGLLPRELVHARAYWVWWSYGEDPDSHQKQGWDLIMSYVRVPFQFFSRTHFEETFARIR